MTMRKLAAVALAATLAVGLSACGSDSQSGASMPQKPAENSQGTSENSGSDAAKSEGSQTNAEAEQNIKWGEHISEADFQAAIDAGAQVVDVRTPAEFNSGHLPGAINIDVNSPDATDKFKALDPNKSYAVYCRSGARSRSAVGRMEGQGIKKVVGLEGGINSWTGPTQK